MQIYTNTYLAVEHLTPDAANADKEGYVADAGLLGVAANVQPSSPEMLALNNGAYGKSSTIFTTVSGILEGDRLTLSGSATKYIVKGRQFFNYGLGQHLELYVEEVLG